MVGGDTGALAGKVNPRGGSVAVEKILNILRMDTRDAQLLHAVLKDRTGLGADS